MPWIHKYVHTYMKTCMLAWVRACTCRCALHAQVRVYVCKYFHMIMFLNSRSICIGYRGLQAQLQYLHLCAPLSAVSSQKYVCMFRFADGNGVLVQPLCIDNFSSAECVPSTTNNSCFHSADVKCVQAQLQYHQQCALSTENSLASVRAAKVSDA